MILLDTNIVSEAWRPRPSEAVIAWVDAQPVLSLYLCTPVLAELRYGVERMPDNPRKVRLQGHIDTLETEGYRDRILPFDQSAALEFGRITAVRERMGRRMEPLDAFIAAIALSQKATLATRDVGDFAEIGLDLVNPFDVTTR
jgi:predicted nucleic acid-binding protein